MLLSCTGVQNSTQLTPSLVSMWTRRPFPQPRSTKDCLSARSLSARSSSHSTFRAKDTQSLKQTYILTGEMAGDTFDWIFTCHTDWFLGGVTDIIHTKIDWPTFCYIRNRNSCHLLQECFHRHFTKWVTDLNSPADRSQWQHPRKQTSQGL